MQFLCDAIDETQSVEGTLTVLGKYLKTVSDKVHFAVNLYSFSLPLVPQETLPSLRQVIYLLLRQNNFHNSPLL